MVRKQTVYTVAMFAWGILVTGVFVAVFTGNAAPYLTTSMLPFGGPTNLAVFGVVPLIAGVLVIGFLRRRAWRKAGQQANLSADGLGLIGTPDMVGERGGRSVSVRTVKRHTGSSGENGSSSATYTVVDAALAEPSADGIIIGVGEGDGTDFGDVTTNIQTTSIGEYQTVSNNPERAERLLSPATKNALEKPNYVDAVHVGDASTVLLDALPDGSGGIGGKLAGMMKNRIEDRYPGDPTTVTIQTKGLVLGGDEMAAQVDTVATVAEEFEATAAK